jgi:hypothetical protein
MFVVRSTRSYSSAKLPDRQWDSLRLLAKSHSSLFLWEKSDWGVNLIIPFSVQFKCMWSCGSLPTLCLRDVVITEVKGEKYVLRLNIYCTQYFRSGVLRIECT